MRSTDARALSGEDIPHGHGLLVRSCEDCACPTPRRHTGSRSRARVAGETPLVRADGVLDLPLDDEHHVLFSPHGRGGVVVVNRAAHEVFRAFDTATSPADLVRRGGDPRRTAEVVARLVEQDLVHERGAAPTPEFAESRELTAWLHVTNECNLRCTYCYVHKSPESMDAATGRQTVDALVGSALRHGFRALRLKYAGGEASLNPDVLFDLHDYAAARCAEHGLELSAVLLSNGVAIPDRLAARLLERDVNLMISLDALGEAHDAQRPTRAGKPSARRVVRTVDRLVGLGLKPHLSITVTGRTTGDVAAVVRFALERDLTFSFNFFRDNDCAAGAADLRYEERALVSGLVGAFAVIEEMLPPWSVLGSVLDRGQLLEPRRTSCGVGDNYVVVDQRGQIAKCHMDIGSTLGDVRATDPVAAIRDDTAGVLNLLVEDKEGCRDCTWRNWCSGGCALATFRATGRFDVRSPNCNIYRAVYPAALRLEGLRVLRFAEQPA
ncbi:radical SAM protein [Actinosynnema sp. NPDC053489]|uniref:radical SAM protein n=1 Tax=Actinosynnema sp. NPDC053489 TaxID=3363916 RepID=UPI0037C78101